jgi:multimeric flavodoxin WrbA
MKIALINASPRGKRSNSQAALDGLAKGLPDGVDAFPCVVAGMRARDFDSIADSDAIALAFPLYVDGIPASTMRAMTALSDAIAARRDGKGRPPRLFVIVNCGFPEGIQNEHAIRMCERFARESGLTWGGGIGIGTGEMLLQLTEVPDGVWIKKKVSRAISALRRAMLAPEGRMESVLYVKHGLPAFAYRMAGTAGWKKRAKRNGLSPRDLWAAPYARTLG